MTRLSQTTNRFSKPITIIEGGSGTFNAVMDEPPQGSVASYQFTEPRRLMRLLPNQSVPVPCVIRNKSGDVFIVADLGSSVDVFRSYRLFDVTGQYTWERRGKQVDPVTNLPKDSKVSQNLGLIWGVMEPQPEQFDRQIRSSFEINRFVTNKPIQLDDIVNGERVMRVDQLMGVYVASLG